MQTIQATEYFAKLEASFEQAPKRQLVYKNMQELEDMEDIADAEAILDRVYQGTEPLVSADELVKNLGLEI
jgi:hypothetical protein